MSLKSDAKYVMLNCIINRIPSWHIRKTFYLFFGMKIGASSRIGIKTIVVAPQKICIGERTIINEFCHLDGRGGLTIGNDTSISIYTKIITASHKLNSEDFQYFTSPVKIDNNVWIGAGAIILDGSSIQEGSVVGAGCVFKGVSNVGDIYIGNPAHMIKKRELKGTYMINYHPHFR